MQLSITRWEDLPASQNRREAKEGCSLFTSEYKRKIDASPSYQMVSITQNIAGVCTKSALNLLFTSSRAQH